MDYSKLEKNIIDVIKEEQIKLGYRSEVIRLYYPLQSLNRFLGTSYDIREMQKELQLFSQSVKDRLGKIEVSNQKDRFCFLLSPQISDYVHEHMDSDEFIYEFINTVSNHESTLDDVLAVFYKHSDNVHVEKVTHGEFDYLVYFENGIPDEFRYCITDEGCHIIYHRFTVDDYNDFQF